MIGGITEKKLFFFGGERVGEGGGIGVEGIEGSWLATTTLKKDF